MISKAGRGPRRGLGCWGAAADDEQGDGGDEKVTAPYISFFSLQSPGSKYFCYQIIKKILSTFLKYKEIPNLWLDFPVWLCDPMCLLSTMIILT